MPADKTAAIDHLRTAIAAIEQRPALAENTSFQKASGGILDLVAAPAGLLHEVFSDEPRNSAAALGFVLGMARPLLTSRRPAIVYLQLDADAQKLGFPYALGFFPFGIDPAQLVFARLETIADFLWTMEEAIACQAVAAVIADFAGHHRELDFTVSRRLNLRTDAAGTSAFLLRYGSGREAGASQLRWHIQPGRSGRVRFDAQAPGPPRFAVTLEKGRLRGMPQLEGQSFVLDWVDNHGFVLAGLAERTGQPPLRRSPAPSRPQPALLGDRLSETG